MDRDVLEGGFDVQFGHKTVLTEIFKYGNCVIYFNVLERIVFREWDVGIDTSEAVFGVGWVEYCSPFCGMSFRDCPNRVNLKIWKGRGKSMTEGFSLAKSKLGNSCRTRGPL